MAVTLKLASEPPFTVKEAGELVILGGVDTALTVTLTTPLTVLYLVESVGVNVTDCMPVPTLGVVDGELNANAPSAEADPPLSTEDASVCPELIEDADGHT